MKTATLILSILFAVAAAFYLTGCETVTDPTTGQQTTRFDAAAATSLIETGFQTLDRYERQSHIIGYDHLGNPVYRTF